MCARRYLRGQARVFLLLAVGLAGRVHSSVSFSSLVAAQTRTTSARQAPQRKPKVHFKMPQPVGSASSPRQLAFHIG